MNVMWIRVTYVTIRCFVCVVMQSRDPSTNVVLLEDAAAVLGVILAASCMGLTSLTGKQRDIVHKLPYNTYMENNPLPSPLAMQFIYYSFIGMLNYSEDNLSCTLVSSVSAGDNPDF